MKIAILIAVTLLVILATEINEAYKFGDIIAFKRKVYTHYGVFVGTTEFSRKNSDEDYFHFTGTFTEYFLQIISKIPLLGYFSKYQPKCVFGSLENEKDHKLDNYLDGILYSEDELKKDENNMKSRIEEKYGATGYSPFSNNCEHLATYVRYGIKISLQCGRRLASFFVENPDLRKTVIKYIKEEIKKANSCACPLIVE